ncbi:MAG: hypothetical protein SNJ71_01140 [Bacteroidales bacterium]
MIVNLIIHVLLIYLDKNVMMDYLKKYIVVMLLGIFSFPIAYQSYHILYHHYSQVHCNEHICCEKTTISNKKQILEIVVPDDENQCPICNYHFSVNKEHSIKFFTVYLPLNLCTFLAFYTEETHKYSITQKSPRAPPFFIS